MHILYKRLLNENETTLVGHLLVDIKVKLQKYVFQTDPAVPILFLCVPNYDKYIVLSYELLMLTFT